MSRESEQASDVVAVAVDAHEPTAVAQEGGEWVGRVLDERYRILRLLGEGGMGAVFIAEQLTLHKTVALKVVRAELAGNGEVAARFAREAMATAQFEHPHVASAIDYGTLPEGGAYFVMQLVRGRSLRAMLSDGQRLPWRRACELCAQVADALAAAEAAGIIHRDLKPDNVLVERREDGSDLVKVLDFGIAHVAPRDGDAPEGALPNRQLTRVGSVIGTPGYMAPEQAVGDKVDHRADLYALGVVLWECIAGRELWDGPDLTTVVTRQMSEPVPKLRELAIDPSLPAELDEWLERLTCRAVEQRPEHAADVRNALRSLANARESALSVALAGTPIAAFLPKLQRVQATYLAQQPRARYLQAGALGLSVLLLVLLTRSTPPATGTATVIDKLVQAQATYGAGKALVPAPVPSMPPELREATTTLIDGDTLRARRAAADKILAYEPKARVLSHVRLIAELEAARGCKARKEAIGTMASAQDVRYLPPLQRLSRAPKTGCGFLDLGDCYGCIRADVRVAIDTIERARP